MDMMDPVKLTEKAFSFLGNDFPEWKSGVFMVKIPEEHCTQLM